MNPYTTTKALVNSLSVTNVLVGSLCFPFKLDATDRRSVSYRIDDTTVHLTVIVSVLILYAISSPYSNLQIDFSHLPLP